VKNRLKKIGINLLKLGVSVSALWWVIHNISFKEVIAVVATSNIFYLGIALFFLIISFIFSAFRQNLSLRITGAHLTQMLNIKLLWLGMYYNLFLPGGIGGDGYKVYIIHKYRKNSVKKNIGAMLVNRISGLVAIGMMTIVLYYLSGINIQINLPYGKFAWIGIPLVYVLYLVVLKYFFKSFFKIHAGLFWWSLALQMMQFISAIFILWAFHQSADLFDYLFLFFISAIATALPITIGGIGAREMVFFYGAKFLGLNYEVSISLSLMFFVLSAFLSVWGVYWVFYPPFRRELVPAKVKEPKHKPAIN
jgi:glycosyltransferase 2 family protein